LAINDLGIATASQNVAARSFGSGAPPDLVEWAKLEVIQTPDFVARAAIASLNKSDTRELLWRITVPTLVIVGEKDIITPPAESRALSDGIPNSTLAVIENAGHFPMLEQPLSSIGRFVFFSTSMQVHPIMMVSSTAQLLGVSSTIRLIGKSVKPGRTTRT
jgi:pimeloyl-ACP methyl ester carboxylesterase